jgi:hypothetical protein
MLVAQASVLTNQLILTPNITSGSNPTKKIAEKKFPNIYHGEKLSDHPALDASMSLQTSALFFSNFLTVLPMVVSLLLTHFRSKAKTVIGYI